MSETVSFGTHVPVSDWNSLHDRLLARLDSVEDIDDSMNDVRAKRREALRSLVRSTRMCSSQCVAIEYNEDELTALQLREELLDILGSVAPRCVEEFLDSNLQQVLSKLLTVNGDP